MTQEGQWYTNKELFEMVHSLQEQMGHLSSEIQETRILIRDYNGLRQRVDNCERCVEDIKGRSTGSKEMWGYVVGGIGVILALISFAVKCT